MISRESLMTVLSYDAQTGLFTRNFDKKGHKKGSVAGCKESSGYTRVTVLGRSYRAHRLAWMYVFGYEPSAIDHINGDRSDNRIENLREADQRINNQNRHAPVKAKSGFAGVTAFRGKWRSSITDRRKQIHLGVFDSPHSASAAYIEAKRKLHEGATI